MKTSSTVLTREEREILILGVQNPDGRHPSNAEIAAFLGIPVTRVKTLMHQACLKLGADNRNEAVLLALKGGEISLDELFTPVELAQTFAELGPDGLRRIAQVVRRKRKDGYLPEPGEQLLPTVRRPDGILTNRERDVIICAGHGLSNKEIAAFLYISTSAVRNFLNRASRKLGARKRADAITLALRRREIGITDLTTVTDLLQAFDRLGPESIEKVARLLEQQRDDGPGSTSG